MGSLFWKYNFAYVYVPNVESGGRVSCLFWPLPAFSSIAQRGCCTVQQAAVPRSPKGNAMSVQLWMDMFDHIMVGLFFFQIIMTGE